MLDLRVEPGITTALRFEWKESMLQAKIADKADRLREYLASEFPDLLNKKVTLEGGSLESGIWHSGYYIALCDVIRFLNQNPFDFLNAGNPRLGNEN